MSPAKKLSFWLDSKLRLLLAIMYFLHFCLRNILTLGPVSHLQFPSELPLEPGLGFTFPRLRPRHSH